MKLATLNNGTRDGQLILVSRDLQRAVSVSHLVPTLQAALDDWTHKAPLLEVLAKDLEAQRVADSFVFRPCAALSPLPRAYQWVDGSAYVNHVQLVRRARGAEMPESFWTEPLVYQGGSDDFLAPMADAVFMSEAQGIDFEAEVAVITDDVAMGSTPDAAYQHIKLLLLVNDWSLRNLIPAEIAKGFGFYVSKPATAFSPVAVTPDELGKAWDGSKLHLPLLSMVNRQLFGQPNAGVDMTFDFASLISHITQTRRTRAGAIVGSGTVSNHDASTGSSCIVERRAIEQLQYGEARTPYLHYGDVVRIEMRDTAGHSIFGAIEQRVAPA